MSFFKSDIVRSEMAEISRLQEEVYSGILQFQFMTDDKKIDHMNLLEDLLDKQKILYTRLSLSDDPEAVETKEKIYKSAIMMGLPSNLDMNVIFNDMSKILDFMKKSIDKSH